jgi:hypothetical protein
LTDTEYDGEKVTVAVIDAGLEMSETCLAGAAIGSSISLRRPSWASLCDYATARTSRR